MIDVLGLGRLKWLHFSLYFIIGWSGLMFIPDWIQNNMPLLWMIIVGGIIYTVGMIPFARSKKYDHFIWHFFVIGGALLHWFGIYLFIKKYKKCLIKKWNIFDWGTSYTMY